MTKQFLEVKVLGSGAKSDPYRPDVPGNLNFAAFITSDSNGKPVDSRIVCLVAGKAKDIDVATADPSREKLILREALRRVRLANPEARLEDVDVTDRE